MRRKRTFYVLAIVVVCATTISFTNFWGTAFSKVYDVNGGYEGCGIEELENGYILLTDVKDSMYVEGYNLMRTDEMGEEKWRQTFIDTVNIVPYNLAVMSDSSFVAIGNMEFENELFHPYEYRLTAIKFDSTGNLIWYYSYQEDTLDYCIGVDLVPSIDGGCVIVGGYQYNNSFNGLYLTKINKDGQKVWSTISNINVYDLELASKNMFHIAKNDSSEYYIAFYNRDTHHAMLMKIDDQGSFLWEKDLYGSIDCYVTGLQVNQEGEIVIGGGTSDTTKLIVFDRDGNKLWHKSYGDYNLYDILCANEGGYFLVGKHLIAKTNRYGLEIWNHEYDELEKEYGFLKPYRTTQTRDGGCALFGRSDVYNPYLLKLDEDGLIYVPEVESPSTEIRLYPNPATDKIIIDFSENIYSEVLIELFNANGVKVQVSTQFVNGALQVNRNDLPAGLYFVKITQGNRIVSTNRMIFI